MISREGEGKREIKDGVWASLVVQLVKNLPAKQETLVQEDPGSGRSLGEGIDYPLLYS